jgi:acetoin utilization protein AcuB
MRERKIGCMPVMDRERLVGIITGVDLLDALVRLCGVDEPSGRLEVRLPDRTGELARLITLLTGRGLDIRSILTYPERGEFVRAVLRIGSMEAHPQARALRSAGYEVLWPPEKPWPR